LRKKREGERIEQSKGEVEGKARDICYKGETTKSCSKIIKVPGDAEQKP